MVPIVSRGRPWKPHEAVAACGAVYMALGALMLGDGLSFRFGSASAKTREDSAAAERRIYGTDASIPRKEALALLEDKNNALHTYEGAATILAGAGLIVFGWRVMKKWDAPSPGG